MTSQVTNRREVGSMSYRGHSRKLRAYTYKELETMRAAPELLGAPTIGRGTRVGDGGSLRSQISLPSCPKYTKSAKKGGFTQFLADKLPKKKLPFFVQKYLKRYIPETFLRNTSILKFFIT
jgi:hypothetical protein